MSKKCKYYREDKITMYTPDCSGELNPVHEGDIEGDYCQFCGRKIKFKELTDIPERLKDN